MLARPLISIPRGASAALRCSYPCAVAALRANQIRTYAQSSLALDIPTLDLAFDKHPAAEDKGKEPIVFLHGLFGSKSNNRSVSKYASMPEFKQVCAFY